MSYPADDIQRVCELYQEGFNQCAIERYTGIPHIDVRRILGTHTSPPQATNELSTRQRQKLLSWARDMQ